MFTCPFLTARWTDLLLLNFIVPVELIERLAPPGTEPDLHDGIAYVSVVGFRFDAVRLFGMAIPGHTNFPEVNLRYYVRHRVGNEVRRGVVFLKEIVPRRAVSMVANRLYNENYVTRPMRSAPRVTGRALAQHDTVEYAWRSRRIKQRGCSSQAIEKRAQWNQLSARVAAPFAIPSPSSQAEFIVEHYWGYVVGPDGRTREYRVTHEPWQVAAADEVTWHCDLPANYNTPIAEYLNQPPANALIAAGSAIQLHPGHTIT
jgi:uncharacterized protein YqjF (DUF2071 family)